MATLNEEFDIKTGVKQRCIDASIISISILPGNRLDYEDNIHRRQKQDHIMDIHIITRRPRLWKQS